MNVACSVETNQYQSGEGQLPFRHRLWTAGAGRKVVIFCHGRGALASSYSPYWLVSTPARVFMTLARYGFAVLAIDAGGPTQWGNDASITAVGNAVAWVRTNWLGGAGTAKVVLAGYSMGGCVALNYA